MSFEFSEFNEFNKFSEFNEFSVYIKKLALCKYLKFRI